MRDGIILTAPPRRTSRPLAGCAILVVVLAVLVSLVPVVHWDGGYHPARYDVRVVDEHGRPVPGATLRVHGPTRESFDAPPGSWPVHEWRGEPLPGDAEGRFVLHQAESGIQFGGTEHRIFGLFPVSFGRPSFELEFTAPGHEAVRVPFDEWNAWAYAARDRRALEFGGNFHALLSLVEVEVVLPRS